jgi:predicted transcriptional regulator
MNTQDKTELMRILVQKKDLLTQMLGLTKQIESELLQDRIEAFQEVVNARQSLISQVDALNEAERTFNADGDAAVLAAKQDIRSIVAQMLELDKKNTALARQKLDSYRAQIRRLNQTKKGVGAYTRPMNQDNAYFIDANN